MSDLAPEPKRRRRWLSGLAKFVTAGLIAFLVAVAALLAFLDTEAGHRLIVDRIAAMTPASGLRVRIGRIDGSSWGPNALKAFRLYDPDGLFAESAEIDMDWRPLDFLWNSLVVHDLRSDLVILHRLPQLIPSREPRPLLPRYDVHIGRLQVRQPRIGGPGGGGGRAGRRG